MIDQRQIKVGGIFRLNPGHRSHSKQPYDVEVVSIDSQGFETKVHGKAPETGVKPHIRRFNFYSREWVEYHQKRFEII